MKTQIKFFVAALLVLFAVSNSFGALNMYLKIAGSKGSSKIVMIKCPDGSCTTPVDNLKADKYTISLCNAQGTLMKAREKANRTKCTVRLTYTLDVKAPRDLATGQATGKVAATSTAGSSTASQDVAKGQTTGKRQHSPVTITKELDAASPFTVVVGVDTDGASITFGKIEWTNADGKPMAADDWEVSK